MQQSEKHWTDLYKVWYYQNLWTQHKLGNNWILRKDTLPGLTSGWLDQGNASGHSADRDPTLMGNGPISSGSDTTQSSRPDFIRTVQHKWLSVNVLFITGTPCSSLKYLLRHCSLSLSLYTHPRRQLLAADRHIEWKCTPHLLKLALHSTMHFCVYLEHALLFKYENTPDMICWEKLIMYFVHKILFPYLCGFKDN